MKYAIDRFVNNKYGKEMEVSASDIYDQYRGGYIPRKNNRFFCPECKEKVFWRCRGGKQPDMFYHQKKTDYSPECDKRVDGNSDLHVYERTGLPLYLTQNFGNEYNLNIGFPAIGESYLQYAFKNNMSVSICNRLTIPITPSRFYSDEITPIRIDFFPRFGNNYILTFSGTGADAIQKKWSDKIDGFSSFGAIFSIKNNGGKKINRGDSITIGQEYYLISENFTSPYSEIQSEKIGYIFLNNINYGVYRIKVIVSVDSTRFGFINDYFYSRFKVWLIEKTSTIVPLWPPIVDQGECILFSQRSELYCDVESGNDLPKIFVYRGKDVRQLVLDIDKNGQKTIKLNISPTTPTIISVDKKYTGREISIKKASIPFLTVPCKMKILKDDEDIIEKAETYLSDTQNEINIHTNTKFDLVLKSANQTYKHISVETEEKTIDSFSNITSIFFILKHSPSEKIISKSINIIYPSQNTSINETQIIKNIAYYSKGTKIASPLWIKELIYFCKFNNLSRLGECIELSVHGGKTYIPLIKYLYQLRSVLIK